MGDNNLIPLVSGLVLQRFPSCAKKVDATSCLLTRLCGQGLHRAWLITPRHVMAVRRPTVTYPRPSTSTFLNTWRAH